MVVHRTGSGSCAKMPAARRRGARDPAAGATALVDPMSYPDKTDMGPTEAHRALGRDRHSFMFEQVRVGLCRVHVCARARACVRARTRACVRDGKRGSSWRATACARLFAWACVYARFANLRCTRGFLRRDVGQVRSVWVARNWCWIFAATVGMLLPPAIEPHLVPWFVAHESRARACARACARARRSPRARVRECQPVISVLIVSPHSADLRSRRTVCQVGSTKPAAPVSRWPDGCARVLLCRVACARGAETCR